MPKLKKYTLILGTLLTSQYLLASTGYVEPKSSAENNTSSIVEKEADNSAKQSAANNEQESQLENKTTILESNDLKNIYLDINPVGFAAASKKVSLQYVGNIGIKLYNFPGFLELGTSLKSTYADSLRYSHIAIKKDIINYNDVYLNAKIGGAYIHKASFNDTKYVNKIRPYAGLSLEKQFTDHIGANISTEFVKTSSINNVTSAGITFRF